MNLERAAMRADYVDRAVKAALLVYGKATKLEIITSCGLMNFEFTFSLARLIERGEVIKEERFLREPVFRLA